MSAQYSTIASDVRKLNDINTISLFIFMNMQANFDVSAVLDVQEVDSSPRRPAMRRDVGVC